MSATADSPQDCVWTVETHHFNNIAVKCVFKCKNQGYKTYSGLHKHYLNKHGICLHREARLDPNNEDEFRRQINSRLAPPAGGSRSGHATAPYAYNPPAAGPSPQSARPSHLRGHRTPRTTSHPTPASLGQESPENSPSRYAGPTPIENSCQNHNPGSKLPVLGEAGPSRSPPIYPTTRHQPYPQSRPQQQGMYTNHSLARGQAKGKGREIPSTLMNCGLPTPNTPSQGNRLEKSTPSTTGPDNGVFIGSHQHPSVDAGYPTTAGTSTLPEPSPPSRYPVDTIVPGNFHRPSNAQEHISPIDSPRGPEGPIPAGHARHRQTRHQQFHPTVAGFFNPTECLPTPPAGTSSLPDGSPRRPPQEQPRGLPRRISQRRRSESLSPPATGSSSPRHAAKQLASHPYPRPAKGSTTSRLARQAHENRRRELSLSTEADVTRETFRDITPPLEGGQSRAVDVRYLQAAALSTDRQNHPANPQVPPTPPHIHPPGRHAPLQSEEPTPPACSTSRSNSVTASQGQPRLRGTQQVNDVQSLGEPSTTWRRPDVPESCGSAQAQEPSSPAVSGPVERLETADESTPPTLVVQEPNQESPPVKRHASDRCNSTEGANKVDEGLRREEPAQNVFPEISWEGWGLIKTPDGFYLPETFNPFPHVLEDLTDQW